jgi:PAS domain-containing protein
MPEPAMKTPNDAVYLASISLENVLCFGPKQTLDLTLDGGRPAQWTIILGDNGLGKTTLLKAAAGFAIAPAKEQGHAASHIYWGSDLEIAKLLRASASALTVSADLIGGAPLASRQAKYKRNTLSVRMNRRREDAPRERPEDAASEKPNLRITSLDTVEGPRAIDGAFRNLCMFGYGATRKPSADPKLSSERADLGVAALFSDSADLINPVEWLLQLDYSVKSTGSAPKKKRLRDIFLRVQRTLVEILPEVDDICISDPSSGEGISLPALRFSTPYGEIPFERMGLGYRTMVAWIVDLAARMFRQYPDSPNPIAEPAVVLVDEIDLHLHPTWQRRLLGWLSERFVNTQFIATAHSPLVVQAAPDAKLAVLRREGDHVVIDQSVQAVTGWRVDQILTSDLFGLPTARPPEFDQVVAERTRILSKQRLDPDDEARLRALDERMAEMPTGENPEDMASRDIIRRAARLLNTKGSASDDPHS